MRETVTGVKGLIFRDGRALILIKANGEPDLPGGRVEQNETSEETLYREVNEETGLKVEPQKTATEWSFMKEPELQVTGMTYYCQLLGGTLKLSPEHSGHRWVESGELRHLNFKKPFLEGNRP